MKQKTVLEQLASAKGRRDEVPNQELAEKTACTADGAAVRELGENLQNKNRAIQSDCIKVLYEIGERNAELIAEYSAEFAGLLGSRNQRMVWGAMTALDAIAGIEPKGVFPFLKEIMRAADGESVIARDHAVGILIKLSRDRAYSAKTIPLLLKQLETCPSNQFPMYVEQSAMVLGEREPVKFRRIIDGRLPELPKESQR